jgi:hypothetical protein
LGVIVQIKLQYMSTQQIPNLKIKLLYKLYIIYKRVFLNCLCMTVHGWSSMPVPPGTILLLPYVRTSQTSFFGDSFLQIFVFDIIESSCTCLKERCKE